MLPGRGERWQKPIALTLDTYSAHAVGLAAMRKAAERTQVEIAQKLGVSQARVSQIEQNQDMLLSTLNSYLEAIGGHATLVIHFEGGKDVELDLSSVARGS